jgi:enoyl-CoA hydratase/carnithine racemase
LFSTVLKKWESDKLCLVIIEGSGEKAFCAGGDIRAITSASDRGSVHQAEFFAEEYKLNNLVTFFYFSMFLI